MLSTCACCRSGNTAHVDWVCRWSCGRGGCCPSWTPPRRPWVWTIMTPAHARMRSARWSFVRCVGLALCCSLQDTGPCASIFCLLLALDFSRTHRFHSPHCIYPLPPTVVRTQLWPIVACLACRVVTSCHCVCVVFAQEVDELYARACDYFDEDAVIHVFAAQYYNIYRNNHRIEQIHLTEAEVSGVLRVMPLGCLGGVRP